MTPPTVDPAADESPARPAPPTGGEQLGPRALRGVLWQLFGRGGEQVIRLGSNFVLARLLVPDDFGLMGMVASGLAMADAAAFIATDQAVLAHRGGRRPRFVATAWTIALLRGVILAALMLAVAGPLARWYGAPEATALFACIALQPLLVALAHPGAWVPLRGLRFGPWTVARTVASIIGTLATIVVALALRSAWALLVGQLATTLLTSLFSHVVTPRSHRVRPRIARRELRRILRFSAGAIGTPLLIVVVTQAPALLLGPALGPAILGVYLLHRRLCETGQQLAVQAIGSVMVPVYAELAASPERLHAAWLRTLRMSGLVAFSIAGGLAWLGGDLPAILLGASFRGEPGLFAAMAVAGGAVAVLGVTGAIFWGLGHPQTDRRIQLARAGTILVLGLPLVSVAGATGLAVATAASAFVALGTTAALAMPVAGVPWRASVAALLPGLAAGVACWAAGAIVDLAFAPAALVRVVIASAAGLAIAAVFGGPRLLSVLHAIRPRRVVTP